MCMSPVSTMPGELSLVEQAKPGIQFKAMLKTENLLKMFKVPILSLRRETFISESPKIRHCHIAPIFLLRISKGIVGSRGSVTAGWTHPNIYQEGFLSKRFNYCPEAQKIIRAT